MARPNKGLGHVDGLSGNLQSKHRLRCILSTIGGQRSVDEVCQELGIGPTHFSELRRRVLQGGLDALAPRPVGRPRRLTSPAESEVLASRARAAELERENTILHVRLELASLPGQEAPASKSLCGSTPGRESRAAAPA